MVKDHNEPNNGRTRNATHKRYIDSTLLQSLDRNLAKVVVADTGLKSDATTQCCEIICDNNRRRTESQHHTIGEQFTLKNELFGKAIEDQVEIEFADDGDVEAWHGL